MTGLIQDRFLHTAKQQPSARAIVAGDVVLSYEELDQQSNSLARTLVAAGCRSNDRVVVFSPKSPRAITAFLAVLKAGAVYVPVDISAPAPRLARIFASSDPAFVLTTSAGAGLLADVLNQPGVDGSLRIGALEPGVVGLPLEFEHDDVVRSDPDQVTSPAAPSDPAHLLYTSGSTGDPKGVVISHENVCHFVDWATNYFGTCPGERVSGHPPLHFDLSTFDIYSTIGAGAELHLVPSTLNLLPGKLVDFIRNSELNQWFSVPSILTLMMRSGAMDRAEFPSLTRLLWCGEMMPTPTLQYLMERLPRVRFTNLYGPTEATIASSFYTLDEPPASPTSPIPIGVACPGETLQILDDDNAQTPDGDVGNLVIGGVGLSAGYWRDTEKTNAAFFLDSGGNRLYRTGDLARVGSDGQLYLLGRSDSQIKSRGYRIELGEIEAAMDAIEMVKECAVVGVDDSDAGKVVACAYTGVALEFDEAVLTLRKQLASTLPRYMIPVRWRSYETLPKNANGKIDRRAIRESFEEADV